MFVTGRIVDPAETPTVTVTGDGVMVTAVAVTVTSTVEVSVFVTGNTVSPALTPTVTVCVVVTPSPAVVFANGGPRAGIDGTGRNEPVGCGAPEDVKYVASILRLMVVITVSIPPTVLVIVSVTRDPTLV